MQPSQEQIRHVLVRDLCHPEFVETITIDELPFNGEYFCSTMFRAKLVLRKNGQLRSVLVKTLPPNFNEEQPFDLSNHFHNERYIYEVCVPELFKNEKDLFPEVHLFSENMLVFDDLAQDGFKMGPKPVIDLQHFKLALEGLGRLHAASLAFKLEHPERFEQLSAGLKENVNDFYNIGGRILGLDMLKHYQEIYQEEFRQKDIEKLSSVLENYNDNLNLLKIPKEPWSLICHGDFNRNNMLFKYDNNNVPVAVKFVDFQTSGRFSPAIDLSFFIYLNSNQTQRDQNGREMMKFYITPIENKLKTIPGGEIFNLNSFLEEYSARAFYGIMITCSFLRTVLSEAEVFESREFKPQDPAAWDWFKQLGGRDADQKIADLIHDCFLHRYWPINT